LALIATIAARRLRRAHGIALVPGLRQTVLNLRHRWNARVDYARRRPAIPVLPFRAMFWTTSAPASASSMTAVPKVALLLETSNEYGRGLLRGIVRYARLNGPWSISVSPGHLRQALPRAETWQGHGIITRIRSAAMARAIRTSGLPVVASSLDELDAKQETRGFCEIRTDSPGIARMAARHLLERGLRDFAFCGFRGVQWSIARESTFRDFLRRQRFTCNARRIGNSDWIQEPHWIQTHERDQAMLAGWLKKLPKPVGIMACNDICGVAILQACAAIGLRVPDDVAVVGVDNDELLCGLSDPPLSSVALNLEHAGYEAAAALDAMMAGRAPQRQFIPVEPTVVVARRSTQTVAADDPLVTSALQFIRDHSGRAIDVPHVVRELRTSRRTLERRFAESTGRSVLAEITRCRLERAKRLLLETDMPIRLVAAQAGFNSIKTFIRSFQLAEGRSATAFRERFGARHPGGSGMQGRPM
jgi:LacI family transcriptional regulator